MMTGVIPERMGVYKRFPSVKSYLKTWERLTEEALQATESDLERYANEGRESVHLRTRFGGFSPLSLETELGRVAAWCTQEAVVQALRGAEPSGPRLAQRAAAYRYWSVRVKHVLQQGFTADYLQGKRSRPFNILGIETMACGVAKCLAFGWEDLALDLVHRAYCSVDANDFGSDYAVGHPRTHLFILRLVGSWKNLPEPKHIWPWASDEPIFNELLARWRTPDAEELRPWLLAACDRHTHQSRYSSKEEFDFVSVAEWYDPYEVLTVLCLRKMIGLENPQLDHPLMNTPLGVLPDPVPPYHDDLLDRVLERARMDWPEI